MGTSLSVNKAIENNESLASTVDCQAAFYTEAYEGPLPSFGGVVFHNFSEGDFTSLSWDFGDGSFSSDAFETVTHFYNASGSYEVTLSIWDNNLNCYSAMTEQITVTLSADPCDLSSCVYPGDANNDGKADLNDLMCIGMGFGMTGPERIDADPNAWTAQPALDWNETTADAVNYKHFDSDGNGLIDYQDFMPLLDHYSPMNNGLENTESNGPKVYLDFDVDTVFIDDDTESIVTLSAGIVVGSSSKPMNDIYGMALYFEYDSTLTESTEGVVVNYNDNSFFGDPSEVIAYGHELRESQQTDIGITRLDGQNTSGYGRVATVNFIIIIDIIGDRAETVVPFDVPVSGIKVVDKDGNIIDVSLQDQAATVIFVKETPTKVDENPLARQGSCFP